MNMFKLLSGVAVGLCLVGSGGAAVYFYGQAQEAKAQYQAIETEPQQAIEHATQDLLTSVGELIVLPTDEVPTIATVNDLEKLKGQAFFAQAKIGYKVLIYAKNKKAILYDPEGGKIVEVAPLNIGGTEQEAAGLVP